MPTQLPGQEYPQAQQLGVQSADYLSAYVICLGLEHRLTSAGNSEGLRHCRILGFLLLNAPSELNIRSEVAGGIHRCKDDAALIELGKFFENGLLIAFKKFKGRTPKPTSHPSRSSFEIVWDQMKANIKEAPKNHIDAKNQALIRDNGRCVVTGAIHVDGPADSPDQVDPDAVYANTECAHIIPESIFFGVADKSDSNNKLSYSSAVLALLQRFGYDIDDINGERVHALTNVITLDRGTHDAFDRLQLYFESTTQENHYEVKTCRGMKFLGQRQFVTLSTSDSIRLPVTSPKLLALHACCCKVAYLSGAAEYIDKIYRDGDTAGVLADDGMLIDYVRFKLIPHSLVDGAQG